MQNLIRLIQKYRSVLVFIFFQFIAFTLLFSGKHGYHRAAFTHSANHVVGQVYNFTSAITAYLSLQQANNDLLEENVRLKELLSGHTIRSGDDFIRIDDTICRQTFWYLGAKVINSSKKLRQNYITINKGESNYIKPEMGVVGSKGVVGITVSCSDNFSTVMPVINPYFEVAVLHESSKSFGLLSWKDESLDWNHVKVDDIPNYISISKGDRIVTRGGDGIFPEGELIGYVENVNVLPGQTYHELIVKLAEDFGAVYHVKVIKNIVLNELLPLEQKMESPQP